MKSGTHVGDIGLQLGQATRGTAYANREWVVKFVSALLYVIHYFIDSRSMKKNALADKKLLNTDINRVSPRVTKLPLFLCPI
jgi:hypothetical protein